MASKSKKRVLLVEDDPGTIDVVSQELTFLGYDVAIARSGEEGVERAASLRPDLIIMDIRMPRMDGLAAAARIRDNPKTRSIPILAATAKALEGDRDKCLASGCDGYISKPFTHRQLGLVITKLLEQKARNS